MKNNPSKQARLDLIRYLEADHSKESKLWKLEEYEEVILQNDMQRFWFLSFAWTILLIMATITYYFRDYMV